MIVVRHARVVEDAGVHRIACELDDEVFGLHGLDGLAGDEVVELLHRHALVCRPCNLVARRAEEARHAILSEGLIVAQRGDVGYSSPLDVLLE